MTTIPQLATIDALSDAGALGAVVGQVASLRRSLLATPGYSGAVHERLDVALHDGERVSLVLKRTRLDRDFTAYRTGDTIGREAMLLAEPALAGVWQVFRCPYRAFAIGDGTVGLLMDDVSAHLLPDVDEPLAEAEEDALLSGLARLHARYWGSPVLRLPWLAQPHHLFGVIGPRSGEEEACRPWARALFETVTAGWKVALARVPSPIAAVLTRPAEALARECASLPRTVVHGDAKVANFAPFPDGRVAAFDWEWVAAGPATLDLGWYLAVNSGRLARTKEEVIARYRSFLESALGFALSDAVWERMASLAVLCGGVMLLWAKALALESGHRDAAAEWNWWVGHLAWWA